jgi:hypothetical protein
MGDLKLTIEELKKTALHSIEYFQNLIDYETEQGDEPSRKYYEFCLDSSKEWLGLINSPSLDILAVKSLLEKLEDLGQGNIQLIWNRNIVKRWLKEMSE